MDENIKREAFKKYQEKYGIYGPEQFMVEDAFYAGIAFCMKLMVEETKK